MVPAKHQLGGSQGWPVGRPNRTRLTGGDHSIRIVLMVRQMGQALRRSGSQRLVNDGPQVDRVMGKSTQKQAIHGA